MQLLEVAADRDTLGQHFAVVEFEHGDSTQRILLQKFRLPIYPLHDVDFFQRHLKTFLGQKDAHAAWVGSKFEIVNLHLKSPPGLFANSPGSIYTRVDRKPAAERYTEVIYRQVIPPTSAGT